MAIQNITEYCAQAGELASSCNDAIGASRGIALFVELVSANALFVALFAAIAALVTWILVSVTK
jgi:hypothetical protein